MVQIVNPVTIVKTGGGSTPLSPSEAITFCDLDGNIVEMWDMDSLASKTALPPNPTAPTGLTAKGWNWTLQELQTENKPTVVGQMYAPTDGKTHLFVEVDANHLEPNLSIGINGTAIVDWGDGSATTTLTGSSADTGQNSSHTYAQAGSYEVTIEIPVGSQGRIRGNTSYVSFLWKHDASASPTDENKVYCSQARKLWLGERVDFNGSGSLFRLGIEELVIPDYYPSSSIVAFVLYGNQCYRKAIIVPKGITTIAQQFASTLTSFDNFVSLPNGLTSIGWGFLQNGVTFKHFLSIPNSVTSIGNAFLNQCTAFNQPIYTNATTIGETFIGYCSSFNRPVSIPSANKIGSQFMTGCYAFDKTITIPSSVTNIGTGFMNNTYSLTSINVETNTSPTDNNSLSVTDAAQIAYTNGITITGSGRSSWITNLPNRDTNPFRKLI